MYLGIAYQRSSPDWDPGNRAVECIMNHWMMQYYPWYVLTPTAPPIYVEFLSLVFKPPKVVSHCMPLYSARGKPIIVQAKLQAPGTEFQLYFPLQVKMSKLDVTNTTIVTPL